MSPLPGLVHKKPLLINRSTMSYPAVALKKLPEGLADKNKEDFRQKSNDCWTGTARIPHAAMVADILGITNGYYPQ